MTSQRTWTGIAIRLCCVAWLATAACGPQAADSDHKTESAPTATADPRTTPTAKDAATDVAENAPPEPVALTGIVVDANDGQPIAKPEVVLQGMTARGIPTPLVIARGKKDGSFRFRKRLPTYHGRMRLLVRAEGHIPCAVDIDEHRVRSPLAPIELRHGCRITGALTEADDVRTPIDLTDARVLVQQEQRSRVGGQASTDLEYDSDATIFDYPVNRDGAFECWLDGTPTRIEACVPGTLPAALNPFTPRPDQRALELVVHTDEQIHGIVVNQSGEPIADAQIESSRTAPSPISPSYADALTDFVTRSAIDGTFDITVAADHPQLEIAHPEYQSILTTDTAGSPLSVTLEPPADGRRAESHSWEIEVIAREDAASTSVEADGRHDARWQRRVVDAGDEAAFGARASLVDRQGGVIASTRVDPLGGVTFRQAAVERAETIVIEHAGHLVFRKLVAELPGEPDALKLDRGARIFGFAMNPNGTALEDAIIEIGEHHVKTGSSGRFSITGLLAGEHDVRCRASGCPEQTTHVDLAADGNEALRFVMQSGTLGKFLVVDAESHTAIDDAGVWIIVDGRQRTVTTDIAGYFESVLPEGNALEIAIRASGWQTLRITARASALPSTFELRATVTRSLSTVILAPEDSGIGSVGIEGTTVTIVDGSSARQYVTDIAGYIEVTVNQPSFDIVIEQPGFAPIQRTIDTLPPSIVLESR